MSEFIPAPLGAWRDFYRSARGVLHGQPRTCSALEDMRERMGSDEFAARLSDSSVFSRVRVPRARYATYDFGRVCRKCAWEPVAAFLLSQSSPPDAPLVTFSMLNADDRSVRTFSSSSNARLARVASSAGLRHGFAGAGSFAFGMVSPAALRFLHDNATVFTLEGHRLGDDGVSVLTAAWSLWAAGSAGMDAFDSRQYFLSRLEQATVAFF